MVLAALKAVVGGEILTGDLKLHEIGALLINFCCKFVRFKCWVLNKYDVICGVYCCFNITACSNL